MVSHTLVWPLDLGIRTSALWCGSLTRGYGFPHFGSKAFGIHYSGTQHSDWVRYGKLVPEFL